MNERSKILMCGSRFEGYLCQRRWHRTGKHHHKNISELKGKGERYEMTWWGDAYFPRYGRLAIKTDGQH